MPKSDSDSDVEILEDDSKRRRVGGVGGGGSGDGGGSSGVSGGSGGGSGGAGGGGSGGGSSGGGSSVTDLVPYNAAAAAAAAPAAPAVPPHCSKLCAEPRHRGPPARCCRGGGISKPNHTHHRCVRCTLDWHWYNFNGW